MTIDWHLVGQVGIPVLMRFVGGWVNRWFEKRPALVSYFGHVSAFQHTLSDGSKMPIYTHSVVVRNAGRRSAANVRLRHTTLPSFQIFPSVEYRVNDLPDGAKEIVIPNMVPNEQLTISYLYFPPLTYAGVNAGVRSDEGFAKEIPVLLQRQYGGLFLAFVAFLLLAGVLATFYALVLLFRHYVA